MAKNSTKIEVDLKKLIEVFDERNTKYQGHTAAISVILGEDLNTALFTHYLKNVEKEKNVEILPYKVKTGWPGGHGPQLDRWIKVGIHDYTNSENIVIIEWADKIYSLLPDDYIKIIFTHTGKYKRKITIK